MSSDQNSPTARRFTLFWRVLPWCVVALQMAWWSVGLWPVVPVEGDEQGVIFGVEGMLTKDPALQQLRYYYEVQPGAYHLLATATRVTGASIPHVFAALTALGAVGFAFAGALLLRGLFGWPLGWLVVAMWWCQETGSAGYYLNTSAMAGAIAVAGVAWSLRRGITSWVWAGGLLALAGWIRADSLLIAPACLGLIYWRDHSLRGAIGRTALIALMATAGVGLLYFASGTSPLQGANAYAGRGYFITDARIFAETCLQLLSPALLLAALAGSVLLLVHRNFSLWFIALCGGGATVLVYGTSLTTPKYFYYVVPFALIPALYCVDLVQHWARARNRPVAIAVTLVALTVIAGDAVLGLRTLQTPERYFSVMPTAATLAQFQRGEKQFALVVGPGELALNADGFRVRTGSFFAPWCWHQEKKLTVADLALIREQLHRHQETTLLWSGWVPYQLMTRELFAAGFRPVAKAPSDSPILTYPGLWRNGDRLAHVHFLGHAGSPFQPAGPALASLATPHTLFVGHGGHLPLTELDDGGRWEPLSTRPEGFISVYQRVQPPAR